MNYREFADKAVAYGKENNIVLDYSLDSMNEVDGILEYYHEHLEEYNGETGKNTLWNIAVHFGFYIGETLLAAGLEKEGYEWAQEEDMVILKNKENIQISPLTKAYKRILNGQEDSVKSFCDVVNSLSDKNFSFPPGSSYRAIDVQLASGKKISNAAYKDIDEYIMLIADGEEDFIILESHDGFLQFYGLDNQFVGEIRVNLEHDDFRTYSLIDKEKVYQTERVTLTTPFGEFTPQRREVVSLEQIKATVLEYYRNITEEELLKKISCVDTTAETKAYMGK